MGDLFFVVKCFVVTVAIIVALQIKIGSRTIEQRSLSWLHQSHAVEQLQEVTAGAVRAGRKGVALVSNVMGVEIAASKPAREEQRILGLKVRRSEAYYRQKERQKELEKEKGHARDIDEMGEEAGSTNAELN